tara:strand:+ start:169 stop:501 length:333 start_codon:yes stop_codon:yes gene_type:complete
MKPYQKLSLLVFFTTILSPTVWSYDNKSVQELVREATENHVNAMSAVLVEQTAYQLWGDMFLKNIERSGLNELSPQLAMHKLKLTVKECGDIGFKMYTEKFGNCVLDLIE